MTWVKVHDGLDENEKIDMLLEADELHGLAAVGLWTLSLSSCGRKLTDGVVSQRTLRRIAPAHGEDLAQRLLGVGLFDPSGTGDEGFVVHDFLEHNPSREDVLERRRIDAERKADARAKAAAKRKSGEESHGPSLVSPLASPEDVRADIRADSEGASALPDPTRPDPTPRGEEEGRRASASTTVPAPNGSLIAAATASGAFHPDFEQVMRILGGAPTLEVEPLSVNAALQSRRDGDALAAAHTVLSWALEGDLRVTAANRLLISAMTKQASETARTDGIRDVAAETERRRTTSSSPITSRPAGKPGKYNAAAGIA